MLAEVHRAMQDAGDFHPTVARALDDEVATANTRPRSPINVGPQPPAIGVGGDFFERIPQGTHPFHRLLPAPFTYREIVNKNDVVEGEFGKPQAHEPAARR